MSVFLLFLPAQTLLYAHRVPNRVEWPLLSNVQAEPGTPEDPFEGSVVADQNRPPQMPLVIGQV